MIITKLQGGLGNQMFQYAAGRAQAIRDGSELLLDTSWYDSQSLRALGLNAFNIHARTAAKEEIAEAKKGKGYLDGYWQSEKYFARIEDVIRKEFTLKDAGGGKFQQTLKRIQETNSVSLHIRRTDYLAPKHQTIYAQMSLEYYEKAVERIQIFAKDVEIFVFSDDIDWVKKNLKIVGVPMTYVSSMGFSAEQELFLMSQCKYNITANSTFSWWGAWLNSNPNKIVVTPEKWFLSGSMSEKDLIPSTWIKL